MKKITIFLLIFISFVSRTYAAEVLKFGTHLACNTSESNLKKLRGEYDRVGQSGKWIPVTAMVTSRFEDKEQGRKGVIKFFENSLKYQVWPTIRLATGFGSGGWDKFTPGDVSAAVELFSDPVGQTTLADLLKKFPKPIYLALGNEPNYGIVEWSGRADAREYHDRLAEFINLSTGKPYKVVNGAMNISVASGNGNITAVPDFWDEVKGLVESLGGVAYNPYELSSGQERYSIHAYRFERNYIGAGGKPTLLLEFGKNPSSSFEEKRKFLEEMAGSGQFSDIEMATPLLYKGGEGQQLQLVVFGQNGVSTVDSITGGETCAGGGEELKIPLDMAVSFGQPFGRDFSINREVPQPEPTGYQRYPIRDSFSGGIKPKNDTLNLIDLSAVFQNLEAAIPVLTTREQQERLKFPDSSETAQGKIYYPLCQDSSDGSVSDLKESVKWETQKGYLRFIAQSRFVCGLLGTCPPSTAKTYSYEIKDKPGPAPETRLDCKTAQGIAEKTVEVKTEGRGTLGGSFTLGTDRDSGTWTVKAEPEIYTPGALQASQYYYGAVKEGGRWSDKQGLINAFDPAGLVMLDPTEQNDFNKSQSKNATLHEVAGEDKNLDLTHTALGGICRAYKSFLQMIMPPNQNQTEEIKCGL